MTSPSLYPIEILLIEDNPGDVRLTQEALRDAKILNRLNVVTDGVQALEYLRGAGSYSQSPRPDMIWLDINLPRKNGLEVLAEIKADQLLRRIPVIILTTSRSEIDVLSSYDLQASCYVTKPLDFNQFMKVISTIEEFWCSIVRSPPKES